MDVESYQDAARDYVLQLDGDGEQTHPPSHLLNVAYPANVALGDLISALQLPSIGDIEQESDAPPSSLYNVLIIKDFLERQHPSTARAEAPAWDLRWYLSTVMLPGSIWAEPSPFYIGDQTSLTPERARRFRALSRHGLSVLSKLPLTEPAPLDEVSFNYFTCLAAFTDPRRPWNSEGILQTAVQLLSQLRSSLSESEASELLAEVLRRKVKPAFAQTNKPRPGNDAEPKPWRTQQVYMPTVLRCILQFTCQTEDDRQAVGITWFSDADAQWKFVHANWPLLVPSILTLLDDPSVSHKAQGCLDLSTFLSRIKGEMLERTGLGDVFERALLPCLSNLPTLTEEHDSIMLLNEAYPTLVKLGHVRFGDIGQRYLRTRSFDKIMQQGILRGFSMAGEHAKIAEVLSVQGKRIVKEMGIDAAPHLKSLLTIILTYLTDPFATTYLPLLVAVLKFLRQTIVCMWPRIQYYEGDVLKAATICFIRLEDDGCRSKESAVIRQELGITIELIAARSRSSTDENDRFRILIESDPRLESLLHGTRTVY